MIFNMIGLPPDVRYSDSPRLELQQPCHHHSTATVSQYNNLDTQPMDFQYPHDAINSHTPQYAMPTRRGTRKVAAVDATMVVRSVGSTAPPSRWFLGLWTRPPSSAVGGHPPPSSHTLLTDRPMERLATSAELPVALDAASQVGHPSDGEDDAAPDSVLLEDAGTDTDGDTDTEPSAAGKLSATRAEDVPTLARPLPPQLAKPPPLLAVLRRLGPTNSAGQVALATGVAVLSLALGACALRFRGAVGRATAMNAGLVFGAAGSLAMCAAVLAAAVRDRRHMHALLANLALCELLLALSFALEPAWRRLGAGAGPGLSCRWLSTVREYLIMCSSAWTTCTALDLYYLMTNPFTSPRLNRRKYQFLAHGAALVSALIMLFGDAFGAPVAVGGFCWVGAAPHALAVPSTVSVANGSMVGIGLFVVAPAATALVANVYVTFISAARFRDGIAATLRARQALLREGFLTTVTLVVYSALLWGIYGGYWVATTAQQADVLGTLFAFLLAYKGSVPFVLWCLYRHPSKSKPIWPGRKPSAVVMAASTRHSSNSDADDDAVRPQMNRALLEELVEYTTHGIAQAVTAASSDVDEDIPVRTVTLSPTSTSSSACRFTDYRPKQFRQIRQFFRIDDNTFLASLATCTTPKVSEGASGAFMFYSTDRAFIVKSLSAHEASFLHSFLDKYAAHLRAQQDSFLPRFLGSYCVGLYGRKAHFVVMENVFDVQHGISIHQRYDIKGSWIDRNAQKPRTGAEATCRHCNLTFRFGVGRNVCPNRAGVGHEPNVVLKDMDLTTKLRFGTAEGRTLLAQLKRDSDFLCEQGIMDYSLLLGVIEVSYQVNQHHILTRDGSVFLQNILATASAERERDAQGQRSSDEPRQGRVKQSTRCLRASEVVIGPGFYYIGLIDILQTWSWGKRIERFIKTVLLRKDPEGISAMAPKPYRDRFHRKLHEIIHLGHNALAISTDATPVDEDAVDLAAEAMDKALGSTPATTDVQHNSDSIGPVDRSTHIRPFAVALPAQAPDIDEHPASIDSDNIQSTETPESATHQFN